MRILALLLIPAAAAASPRHDIDGDGFDDAVLEHRQLFFGSAKGLVPAPLPATQRKKANEPPPYFAAEIVGDVNGDGFADLVFGDPGCPGFVKDMPMCDNGLVHLFLGGPKRFGAKPTQTIAAAPKQQNFGMTIVPLGDIDGDKLADVAISDTTGTHIYKGTKTGLSTTPIEIAQGQGQLVPVGDLDKDGKIDVLAIGPQAATIYYGGDPKRTLAVPLGGDAEFYGTAAGGDFDGDGYGDLAIAVEPSTTTGNLVANDILVYRGSAKGLVTKSKVRFTRDGPRAELGGQLVSVGDLDGDKRDDLVVVASCAQFDDKASSCTGGTAYVYLGSAKGLGAKPVASLAPKRTNFTMTDQVSALGDIDKDGRPDFALGAFIYRGAKGGVATLTPPSL